MIDKALETTYTMHGITRVVRTEPTGNAAKTQAKHTKACKAAWAEVHAEATAPLIAAIDESIANPPSRYGVERYRKDQEKARKAIQQRAKGLLRIDLGAPYKPSPYARNFHGETLPTYDIEPYRSPEPEPVEAPEPAAEPEAAADWFAWLLDGAQAA